jgi:hypothetical protein
MEGVVFLDDEHRKMILVRKTRRVLPLALSGISEEQRFAFYDDVHTTGMDIKHRSTALAAVTLGKDMSFRDYAQGTFRMRGIGQGQRIHLLIIPEVKKLISEHIKECGVSFRKGLQSSSAEEAKVRQLDEVVAWLLLNGMRVEHTQFKMLSEQQLHNVWRKVAFRSVLAGVPFFGVSHSSTNLAKTLRERLFGKKKSDNKHSDQDDKTRVEDRSSPMVVDREIYLHKCMDLFLQRIDHLVESTIPAKDSFVEGLEKLVRENVLFLESKDEENAIAAIRRQLGTANEDKGGRHAATKSVVGSAKRVAEDDDSHEVQRSFNSEQEQV